MNIERKNNVMKYRFKDLRKNIAKILNTTQQHYSRIENGDTEITGDRIIKLAKFDNTSDYQQTLKNPIQLIKNKKLEKNILLILDTPNNIMFCLLSTTYTCICYRFLIF